MKLFELQNNDIDKELANIAGDVSDPSSGAVQNEPDMPGGADEIGAEAEKAEKLKDVDSALIAKVQEMPYTKWNFRHIPNAAPMKIVQMSLDELAQSRNVFRNRMAELMFADRPGLYSDPDMRFVQDGIAFIDAVTDFKKHAERKGKEGSGDTVKFDTVKGPKTKAGPAKTPKADKRKS